MHAAHNLIVTVLRIVDVSPESTGGEIAAAFALTLLGLAIVWRARRPVASPRA